VASQRDKQNARRTGGVTRTVNAGFAHHQAGRLDRAEGLYRKALGRDPRHSRALHLLGVIAYDRGQIQAAIELIERAQPRLQDVPEAHVNLGNALQGAGRWVEAADSYRRAIALYPDYGIAHSNLARALNKQGLFEAGLESSTRALELIPGFPGASINCAAALLGLERHAEAEAPLRRALDLMPDRAKTHRDLGLVLEQLGRLDEAVASYQRAVSLDPNDPKTHNDLGVTLDALGRLDEAVVSYHRALALHPDLAELHCNLGKALQALNRIDEAVKSYHRGLALKPDLVEAYYNLGTALEARKQYGEAAESFRAAIQLRPDFAEAHNNLGNALHAQDRLSEAGASYRNALQVKPDFAEAHYNFGKVQQAQCQLDEAVKSYRHALALKPDFVEAQIHLGNVLLSQNLADEAIDHFQRMLATTPDQALVHLHLGDAMTSLGRLDEAAASYRRVLALEPDHAAAHCCLGNVLKHIGELSDAIACFEKAVALDPDNAPILGTWFRERQNVCDWSGYGANMAKVRDAILGQPSLVTPFVLLALPSTPKEQLDCARRVSDLLPVPETILLPQPRLRPGNRIRLGYLSADFRQHPVAALISEFIERHNRRRFEVIGYSYGPDDPGGAMRNRLVGTFDLFRDIGKMPHRQAAELIRSDGIDILMDLTGYTSLCRPAILILRPAPIQVSYLGYPGTMGADFIDYIIVDRFLVPADQQPFYSEKLVHLPNCYQPGDTRRQIAEPAPTRGECGLPEQGFVFCCFNNSYKFTPDFFDIWMRLLKAVPESVLWLLEANPLVRDNLRMEAERRGLAVERLVFMPRLSMPEYLARLGLADLFLDTLPYNAGATANDALWVGLPVLTCAGQTYVGRMAGALLTAAGLPELITTSPEAYEALALQLTREPNRLAGLRRLLRDRSALPLFDIARYTSDLEAAYTRMWETWRTGRPAEAFSLSPTAERRLRGLAER